MALIGSTSSTERSAIRSGVTKTDVGLDNVDNESKATMFTSPTFTEKVGIRTTDPDAVTETRGLNSATGNSTHGAEEPITMIRGANGSTVQEWVHATREAISPSHSTMYSWYKLVSPGGYSSAGTPGVWEIHCHISGNHATSAILQKFTLVQSNNHSDVGNHGGANYSLPYRFCHIAPGGGAYGASLTVTFWYLSNNAGNNGATFFVRAVHAAREPQFTFYAKYIGCTGATFGTHEQSMSFLGTASNNNHQPSNITERSISVIH